MSDECSDAERLMNESDSNMLVCEIPANGLMTQRL